MIYLDNSATTKPYPEVIDTFTKVAQVYFANPSSIHELGGEVDRLLSQSRNIVARLLQVNPAEIIFTSSGTEGNSMVIKGTVMQYQKRGKHVITTKVEHASNHETFKQLEEMGFDVTYLDVNKDGLISVDQLEKLIREDTILVSVIHVNNETGVVQPVEEIGNVLRKYPKIMYHVDHVQGIGKVPLNMKKANIDFCTLSGHKFHGIKGTGILFIKEGRNLFPLFAGGSQENSLRAGTENVPGIVSTTKALRMFLERSKDGGVKYMEQLKQELMERLEDMDGVVLNTPKQSSAPHIVNFSVPGIKPEVLIHSLGKKEMYVSTKSACSSKQTEASRVLLESGYGTERASSGIRVSLSFDNTKEEIQRFLSALNEIIPTLKKVMG